MSPDRTGSVDERAQALVAGLTLRQKIRLVSGKDFWRTEDLEGTVPAIMVADGPHGLRKQVGASDHVGLGGSVPATCFPVAAVLASTWDPELVEEVGRALGREAKAEDVAILLGPGLNLKRHPRGGRNFEYLSEDPLLSGRMAAALVRGIQAEGVGACAKHFAANNQETARMVVDTVVDERTLRETYLRGFEIVLAESSPAAVMTAYNQVNGEFCSDHAHLVGEVLRGEWGYDGLVVSDWGGTNDRVAGLAVGLDLEMPGGAHAFDAEIEAAVAAGRLPVASLDRAATRVLEAALRWQEVTGRGTPADLDAHHALARRVAAAGTVLLTNDGILPLRPQGTLAVVGAFATQPRYQGAGSSQVTPTRLDSLWDVLTATLAEQAPDVEVRHAPGYDADTGATTDTLVGQATRLAAAADQVVLLVGMPGREEAEGRDRAGVRLPDGHERLVRAVLEVNPRTVVVLCHGGSVELDWADGPAALVEAYLGGQAGGAALVDVLLGAAEPGGRLAESVPVRVADLAADANFPGRPRQVEYRERSYIGYRFHDAWSVPARFPFGHGLSYTRFEHRAVEVSGIGTDLTVTVELANVGDRAGSEVVQVYVAGPGRLLQRPLKELQGFAKVHAKPGETVRTRVRLYRRSFTVWDVASGRWVVEPGRHEVLVGSSSAHLYHRHTVDLESDDPPAPAARTVRPVADDEEYADLLGHPVPVPAPARPFTRTSPLADLGSSWAGRRLLRLVRQAMARRFADGGSAEREELLESVLAGLPVRALAQMGPGPVTFARLDRLLALLNGEPLRALARRRTD